MRSGARIRVGIRTPRDLVPAARIVPIFSPNPYTTVKGGNTMDEPREPHISFRERVVTDPRILGGKATIKNTRIPVWLVLSLLAHDYSFNDIIDAYPTLTVDDIRAALAYASVR